MSAEDTSLGATINAHIRDGGPVPLATYMALCLSHPKSGYYRTRDPFGSGGDFITAPEISQIFGELIGAWIATLYAQMGSPDRLTLLEAGPGRGTLMADALRTACRQPGFAAALDLALIETSPVLIEKQKKLLGARRPRWIEDPDEAGDTPLIVIANEFFDALPIRQFVMRGTDWHERAIGLEGEKRVFGLVPAPTPVSAIPARIRDGAEEGAVYEAGLAGQHFMARLAARIAKNGGAILVTDYGYDKTRTGETLQAVRNHTFADPLANPGDADLSAHVDFSALATAAVDEGLVAHGPVTQGAFLLGLGIARRADALGKANPAAAKTIAAARDRLTGSSEMGTLFKVLAAASPGLQPPGFAP